MDGARAALERMQNDRNQLFLAKAQELLRKSGLRLTTDGETLPNGEYELKEIPSNLKGRLTDAFGWDWKANGFADQPSAESFLLNGEAVPPEYPPATCFLPPVPGENPGS